MRGKFAVRILEAYINQIAGGTSRFQRTAKWPVTVLPNVSFGFQCEDKTVRDSWPCWSASQPLDVPPSSFFTPDALKRFSPTKYQTEKAFVLGGANWEQRKRVPVWRGSIYTPWQPKKSANQAELLVAEVAKSNSEKGYGRLYAVWWSHHNPNLLDARISSIGSNSKKQLLFQQNATNGMSDCCLPLRRIPEKEYYNDHQVALGTDLHAAFRPLGSARRGGGI